MPRPQKDRIVGQPPVYTEFKPAGVRRKSLDTIILSIDEYEAIRLTDYLNMEHAQAAEEMEISRPTFTRLIEQARLKLAQFLIEGKYLSIGGGNIHFRGNIYKCLNCSHVFEADMEKVITHCPICNSDQITDLASEFGHGNCCRERNDNSTDE
ncbi:MAG: DUF134 domain-containing protein [Candidatus Cloacimonetes bacterium]|nr:DUF134 domain-containing protein [Candidatus Cloacimonadota bacterium]